MNKKILFIMIVALSQSATASQKSWLPWKKNNPVVVDDSNPDQFQLIHAPELGAYNHAVDNPHFCRKVWVNHDGTKTVVMPKEFFNIGREIQPCSYELTDTQQQTILTLRLNGNAIRSSTISHITTPHEKKYISPKVIIGILQRGSITLPSDVLKRENQKRRCLLDDNQVRDNAKDKAIDQARELKKIVQREQAGEFVLDLDGLENVYSYEPRLHPQPLPQPQRDFILQSSNDQVPWYWGTSMQRVVDLCTNGNNLGRTHDQHLREDKQRLQDFMQEHKAYMALVRHNRRMEYRKRRSAW